ncbi:MAG: 5-(carboxyamino)imidazole ribonucleotide mutase [Clostridia bacterium]|nr:5-(carboxyamino)imidazole ribonucleotide mutase [Clostridia bacterium]MDI9512331.1 5-(carboxyamino)imidazole ribonucleotide mutase [Bacillota bacterium]
MMQVSIIMGSISDDGVMQQACDILDDFGVNYEKKVLSAHRTPDVLVNYVKDAVARGVKVIIAGAGGAAHLPGVIAAFTTVPVIGVPIKSRTLNGLDSLLSIVQMPSGIPVASMAIDGAKNAALYSISILALTDQGLSQKLKDFRKQQEKAVLDIEI